MILASILVPLYFAELIYASRIKTLGVSIILAIIYFIVIAGLRDDTGYDWYVYKNIYTGVSDSNSLGAAIEFGKSNGSELGFSVFLYVLSWCGLGFWGVQFIVSCFNCYAFVKLNNTLGRGGVTGLLVYFCWLFLVLQMGVMRMSIALAFLSLALVCIVKKNNKGFYLLVIVAGFFHTFAIIIGLLMWMAQKSVSKDLMLTVLAVLSGLYLASIDFAGGFVRSISGYMPAFVSTKLDIYLTLGETYQRGAGELLYKVLMLGVLVFLSLKEDGSKNQRLLLNLGFMYVAALLLFWRYPIFHDRIKYFALMPIFYLLFSVLSVAKTSNRIIYGAGFLVFSFMVLTHEVTGGLFYPYTPYYNMYERWLGGKENDGEVRTLKYYKEFDSQWLGGGQ